ncbi:putative lipid phosphate phosphatase YodM protein [Marine Group I thaumarchaeote SCGC AAA799-E16]|uniref:Glycerophosphoryl diester phosphodiesterase protein n=5 Tax=Marine Group I TaxID=905826 RepID=A0A087RYN1_9ARCH|nr:Putative lipid phosphate phosphatase YodM protein [Marine Group I thaumarchaeote SCGC AAA799-N04]KER06959.1 putative lipid phosphate phosphatase YodM protein [Marine Group I thaumarchaeote SCGC AAA799-E16]KFM16894.1 putative lipid phosphate phosphatase YodM protein [Marine Group I thaumarchaeote SCGC AAA799-D11]KFM18585.1 glycerophosphoryl diester phosphodiesterase protein [Marine Group I thaumarchaeote SCGC RSA3]KFM21294.1 putative lipid phosphate phosphatase YodM protein [Marine Group I th
MQSWLFDIRSRSFVLLTILFLILTGLVYSGVTESFDQNVVSFFSENVGNPTLDIIMQYVTESGDVFNMLIFGIVMLIIPKTRRIGITLMILIVLSTLLTGYIKCGIDRDRPDFDYEGVEFPVEISRDTFALFCEGGFDASYPSGHAARAMIFGIILGYALSERFPRGAYLLFLYPVMISLSRIYVLQHYPMDVIGGTVIGIMLAGVMANRTKLYKIFDKSKT